MAAAVTSHDASPMAAPAPEQAAAQSNDDWCNETRRNNDDDRESFCEVRQFTLGAGGGVTAETSNGSIRVTGERRNDILVRALVFSHARTEARAREIAKDITISQSGSIRAEGPRTGNREGWYVSFRIQAPQSSNIDLTSSNGSLAAVDVRGTLKLRTSNGSIRLEGVGGNVMADTSNGSVNATLAGSRWEGDALDISTSNGSIRLGVPENFNARVVASTNNGSINFGFPVMMQGNVGGRSRNIDTTIGSGGPTLRLRTSNGSISVRRGAASDRR